MPRNIVGLTDDQIEQCKLTYQFLTVGRFKKNGKPLTIALDTKNAADHGSKTRFLEGKKIVELGADVFPGSGIDANSRLSYRACLAHEIAHIERFLLGYTRPFDGPDSNLDEAETSIHASFETVLGRQERFDLVEDAELRIQIWKNLSI